MRSWRIGSGAIKAIRIIAPSFVAGSVWRMTDDGWQCISADASVRWLIGRSSGYAAEHLRRRGWSWEVV